MAEARLEAIVSGRVQGVNFRFYTIREAVPLGLKGYVRNLRSGQVEVVAEGERADLEKLLAFLRRGPSHSRVDGVDVQWGEPQGDLQSFGVRY